MIVAVSGPSQHGSALVLRPSLPRYLRTARATMLLGGVLLVALFLRGGIVGAIAALVILATASGAMSIYFRRANVTVTPDEVVNTGLIRVRRTPRSALGSVVTVALPRSHPASRTLPHLFVLDKDGRRVARLKGSHWLEDDMRSLIRHLGIAPRKLGRVATAKQLAKSYPRAVSVFERHRTITSALVVAPIVAAIIVATVASSS